MKNAVPTYIRLPAELKNKIDAAAKRNKSSRNNEMVARLDSTFNVSKAALADYDSGDLIGELLRRYDPESIMIRIGKHRPE